MPCNNLFFYNCRAFKSPNGAETILITVRLLLRNFYYKNRIRYGFLTTVVFSLFFSKWPSLYLRNRIKFDLKSVLFSTLIIDNKFWKILFLSSSQGLLRNLPEKPLCFNPVFWLLDAVWYECFNTIFNLSVERTGISVDLLFGHCVSNIRSNVIMSNIG